MLATRSERFGPLETDRYDVYEPPGAALGVTVALVHGGLWLAVYDWGYVRPLAAALARAGCHVALVEYARTGMPGGGWPGTGDSVRRAVTAVAADAGLPDPLIAVGHSSGGQLVVWTGSENRCPELTGVVSLSGVVDLQAAAQDEIVSSAIHGLLGGGPDTAPDAWHDADPRLQRLTTPAVILHGRDDPDLPARISVEYHRTRTAEDAACRLEVIDDCEHFGLVDPRHPGFASVISAVRELAGLG
ncbi:MAG: alpha/beta hydrolase [Actinomycetales bacterium]|nr:MAG: alpha/beta hydrolase [Actinomycetales bacterium]